MKTDAPAKLFGAQGPARDAFQAFFDMVDAPAAVCDLDLRVLTANAPFAVLCGRKDISGHLLTEQLKGAALSVPEDGHTVDLDVSLSTGQAVTLTVSRRGQTVAVVARRLSPMLDSLAAAGRALLEQARVEGQLLEIGRQVAGAASEEELVAAVARGVKGLFAGRAFCVRIIDPRTCALTSLYAEGRLREGARDVFYLRHSMLEKTHLDAGWLPADKVKVVSGELPMLFHGSVRGISAPLVASGQLFGAVNIEYPPGLTADAVSDERVLIQLANQVAVAVRNAKLIDELTFVRKYLEELLENANALILVVNREGRVVVFNRLLATLTGLSKGEVLGNELVKLAPGPEVLRLLGVLSGALNGESGQVFETKLLGRGKKEMAVTFSTSTVMSQSGEAEGIMLIGQDLTHMRELEGRIMQTEKLASLGELAASVVHEINNPMTAVATYADALLKRAMLAPQSDPGDVEKFRRIVDNSERVLRFTRDLVSYARPGQDQPEEVELKALLERATGYCDHVVQKHSLKLETSFAEVPKFLGVRQNLVQVFVNLITNAAHATAPQGTITVASRQEGGEAVVTVKDTGAGIPAEVAARVFEPFFTTKAAGKGTGLGLSIVQGIVQRHGGTISLESTVGTGTTFTVRLPLLRQPRG